MFFIMGISQKEKKLNYDQLIICKCCGKYGHINVYMRYTYLMLFFIPILKWNKRYFARLNCCGSSCELNTELGKAVKNGEVTFLDPEMLDFSGGENQMKHCFFCGFTITGDYQFCPKCGNQF